jgi:hypothetical protein
MAASEARAEGLARRALWSVILGLAGAGLIGFGCQLLDGFGRIPFLRDPAIAGLSLLIGFPVCLVAVYLGVPAARRDNTINRSLAVAGVILGLAPIFAGGAIIATRAVRTWKMYRPRPPPPAIATPWPAPPSRPPARQ